MREYLYGMRLRGAGPGCQPKEGLLNVYYGSQFGTRVYHNLISYSRRLTKKEEEQYDLDFINETEVGR